MKLGAPAHLPFPLLGTLAVTAEQSQSHSLVEMQFENDPMSSALNPK